MDVAKFLYMAAVVFGPVFADEASAQWQCPHGGWSNGDGVLHCRLGPGESPKCYRADPYHPDEYKTETPCDLSGQVGSASEGLTAGALRDLIQRFRHNSRMTEILTRDLSSALRSRQGEKPSAEVGRQVSRLMGVGACTRHFYNNTKDYWGIAMYYAGTCEGAAVPNTVMSERRYACLIPPHSTAVLHYENYGDEPNGGQIAVAGASPGGPRYAQIFNLRTVGCHIEHSGGTGAAVLNDPADGDIKAHW